MVHLNLGATTVRFTPEAFEGLASLVFTAVAEMAARSPLGDGDRVGPGLGRRARGEA